MTGEYDESTERTPLPNDPPQPSLARMVLALGGMVAGIGLDPLAMSADLAEAKRLREKLDERERAARSTRRDPAPVQFRHEPTPKQLRPDGADERDLRAAEEKRRRRAERRQSDAGAQAIAWMTRATPANVCTKCGSNRVEIILRDEEGATHTCPNCGVMFDGRTAPRRRP